MKTETKWLAAKIGILVLLGMTFFLEGANLEVLSSFVSFLAVALFVLCFRYKNADRYKKDERTKKLGAYASTYSWMLTLIVVSLLFWLRNLKVLELSTEHTLGVIFFTMIASIIILNQYFLGRGDVE